MFNTLKKILSVCGTHKKRVYWGLVFSVLNGAMASLSIMAFLWILKHVDNLTQKVIWETVALLAIALVGKTVLKYLNNRFLSGAGYIIYTDKRLELGEKLRNAPMGYFNKKTLGQINNTVTSSMAGLENFTMMAIDNVIGGILQGLTLSVFLMIFDWRIGIVAVLGILLAVSSLSFIQKKSQKLGPVRYKAVENTTSSVLEFIRGIAVIRSFGRSEAVKMDKAFDDFCNANTELEKGMMFPQALFRTCLQVFSGIIILESALLICGGHINPFYGLMFMLASFFIYGQMELLGIGVFLLEQVEISLDQLEETFDIPKMEGQGASFNEDHTIELKDITFGYGDTPILKNVSAVIPMNSKCAIVGPSGSGKTTLCNLIVRFFDVQKGEIYFGGKNIREYNPDDLMSMFSIVFQNVFLFNDTIENNIRFGMESATHQDVERVAKLARCHDFIMALPEGYNTVVNEGGSSLSGGEKQRISIARALLKDAPVVILDEATSSVDPENEGELLEAINALTTGKTVISIAHRMNTIKEADQILVIDKGGIAERGCHQELYKQNGIYTKFVNIRSSAGTWNLST